MENVLKGQTANGHDDDGDDDAIQSVYADQGWEKKKKMMLMGQESNVIILENHPLMASEMDFENSTERDRDHDGHRSHHLADFRKCRMGVLFMLKEEE